MSLDGSSVEANNGQNHRVFPDTVETTPRLESVLEEYGVNISYATSERIRSLLDQTRGPIKVRSGEMPVSSSDEEHDISFFEHQDSPHSTDMDPAVCMSFGASHCTLFAVFDHKGVVSTLHEPIVTSIPENDYSDTHLLEEKLDGLMPKLLGGHEQDSAIFLTGMNSSVIADRRKVTLDFMQKKYPTSKVSGLFVRTKDLFGANLSKTERLRKGLVNRWRNIFAKTTTQLPPNMDYVEGIIVIPRKLSKSAKTEVLLMDLDHDAGGILDALFPKKTVTTS